MQLLAYLDWNIFNKLEKLDSLDHAEQKTYHRIKEMINAGQIIVPYSNAHISDLARGYSKNPAYTEAHLRTIESLTNNLCIVLYWGEQKLRWHYRDPKEFLDSALEENNSMAASFSELLHIEGEPLLNTLVSMQMNLMRLIPIDKSFKEIYKADPVFNLIFPRTKVEMNKLALCEDLYQFSARIKTDYTLYRQFQKYLTQLRIKMPQYQKLVAQTQNKIIGKPGYLDWDQLVNKSMEQFKHTSKNAAYDRIMNLFTTTDLKGYHQDEKFANLIDDALHCFYAAHCHYFMTIDKRCAAKSKKVYEKLKIDCKVMTPSEFFV